VGDGVVKFSVHVHLTFAHILAAFLKKVVAGPVLETPAE
jgi:hypothetical protein